MSQPDPTNQVVLTSTGTRILSKLEGIFKKYLALDSGLPLLLALWALATHLFDCFDAFSYLAVVSPTKRCGKTRLAEILWLLCAGAFRTANASAAAMFRMIQLRADEGTTVTLIMDEMEVLGKTNNERADQLREVLNAGYRRGQTVHRCERNGDKFEIKEFNVYCPKVLVLIGALNDTLADRCIPIAMRRRRTDEKVGRFFYALAKREARPVLKEILLWTKTSRCRVRRHLRRDLEFLEDREAELWQPLFAVCEVAAPERLKELECTALRISGSKQSEEPADFAILLLKDIRDAFMKSGEERLSSSRLLVELNALEESPWLYWSNGRGFDARCLARLLRPFRIEPHNLRLLSDSVCKGYQRDDFEEAWDTYLPRVSSATPLQANPGAGSSDFSSRYEDENVAAPKHEAANKNEGCSAVALPRVPNHQKGMEEEL
jgi:hypothetical protein